MFTTVVTIPGNEAEFLRIKIPHSQLSFDKIRKKLTFKKFRKFRIPSQIFEITPNSLEKLTKNSTRKK